MVTKVSRLLFAQEEVKPLLWRLSPELRTAVILALVAIIFLGVFLLVVVIVGGRRARRISGQSLPPSHSPEEDWARHPLPPRKESES